MKCLNPSILKVVICVMNDMSSDSSKEKFRNVCLKMPFHRIKYVRRLILRFFLTPLVSVILTDRD